MSFDSVFYRVLDKGIVKEQSQIELYNEGKKESEALLAKTFPDDTELQQKLLAIDQTPSKGDMPAIVKFYNETNDFNKLTNYFNLYSKLKAKNIPVKAPASFKTFIEFTEHVDATVTKQKLKNAPTAPTIEHEDSADKLVDTEELTIYKGDSHHKCIKYGEGYSFCISRSTGGNMYDSYRMQKESTFYFIFFKKIPKTNPNHVLVLDRTRNGWELTNQLNETKETTWQKIVKKFPLLSQYEDLFVNNPLTEIEEDKMEFIASMFANTPGRQKETFINAEKDFQIVALKQGVTIEDELFNYLVDSNLWDYINEYVSTGLNLTPLQADAIEAKGGAILKQYLKMREIAIPQYAEGSLYKFNKLDENLAAFKKLSEEDYKKVWSMVDKGSIYISHFNFLTRLPDNIPSDFEGDFKCVNNSSLKSLEGAPQSVTGDFHCKGNNSLTSLKGAPQSVTGDFECTHNGSLISLEGAPQSVTGKFECTDNSSLISLKGAPQKVYSFRCHNNSSLKSLEGGPQDVRENFRCTYNSSLISLEGAPQNVHAFFYCLNNKSLSSLKGMPAYIGRHMPLQMRRELIVIKDNKVKFTYEDIQAAMEESKRKLEGKTISRESFDSAFFKVLNEGIAEEDQLEQYNEGVREVLAAVIGLGAVGLLYNINAINKELWKRPESKPQKIEAMKLAADKINNDKFHQIATDAISRIVNEPTEQPKPQAAQPDQQAQSKEQPDAKAATKGDKKAEEPPLTVKDLGNIYDTVANYILPNEIIGGDINAKVNDRFMKPYKDDVGKWTIGVGHLIGTGSNKDKKAFDKARAKKGLSSTLSRKEALKLFNQDVSKRVPRVEEKFKELWPTMSTGLKAVLVDIEYRGDLESKGEGEFDWVELLRKGQYKEAAQKYLDHKEYKTRIKKNPKGDGVVKRMKRNSRIIAAEEPADKLASS